MKRLTTPSLTLGPHVIPWKKDDAVEMMTRNQADELLEIQRAQLEIQRKAAADQTRIRELLERQERRELTRDEQREMEDHSEVAQLGPRLPCPLSCNPTAELRGNARWREAITVIDRELGLWIANTRMRPTCDWPRKFIAKA